ncbi:DNA internalization-related competence protein ComEC/Rec2 [Lactobacillus sp.]|uniref:DNA internalization-related competence protein ComEC/Rec2 n=1 Tax=Lactobacillus sp. TaxID=1591 RepID=UPI003EF3875C
MATRPSPRLKTSLRSSLESGFYFLLGLLLVSLSGLVYAQAATLKIVSLMTLLYLAWLIKRKYPAAFALAFLAILLMAGAILCDRQAKNFQLGENTALLLYPDEAKISDNWLSGKGHCQGQKVSLYGPAKNDLEAALAQGQAVYLTQLAGEAKEAEPATNPGQFDYRRYAYSQHLAGQVKVTNYQVLVAGSNWQISLHRIRWQIKQYLAKLPRLLAFFASELILAENPDSENQGNLDNYRDLGVIHILSISGMHVGLYVLVFAAVGSTLLIPRDEVFAVTSVFLLLEVFLSGFQPGFIRASLMYCLGRFLAYRGLNITSADLLGLVFSLQLFFNPRLLLQTGGMLTYVLAAGLVLTQEIQGLSQSAWLNLLLTPFLLYFFYQVNVATIFYNLLVVPYFNFVVMPATFLAVFVPNLALWQFLEKILEAAEWGIDWIAGQRLGQVIFGQIKPWQLLLLLSLTVLALLFAQEKRKRIKLLKFLALAYSLFFVSIHFPLMGQVSFIDVGQGDSILLTTPIFRKCYLIDTGGKLSFGHKKTRAQLNQITLPMLKAQGIDHLDGVFVSHQDADHVGDLSTLLEKMPVKRLYMGVGLIQNPSFAQRLAGRVDHTQLVELQAGMTVKEKIPFQVLHPEEPGLGENKDSLSLICNLAGKTWGFTGDLDQAGEEKIISEHPDLRIDYFKLGHHGSDTSSSLKFLETIKPQLVFISAGRNNRYHHPKPATLEKLKELGIPYLSTQDSGMITWHYGFGLSYFTSFLQGRQLCYH